MATKLTPQQHIKALNDKAKNLQDKIAKDAEIAKAKAALAALKKRKT